MAIEQALESSEGQHWWYHPLHISTNDEQNKLLPNATEYYGADEKEKSAAKIASASEFSIELTSVFVDKSYDDERRMFLRERGKTNDLLVVTTYQTGTSPPVQRVHYFKEGQEIGVVLRDLFKSLVCSFSDFKDSHVILQPQVYDIDKYDDIKEGLARIFSVAQNVVVAFPVFAPYVAMGKTIGESLTTLLENMDEHDMIMDSNLKLRISDERTGANLLQTGHWIYFDEPQKPGLRLSPNLDLLNEDGTRFRKCSYVLYSIRKQQAQEPNWEVDQKVAKLLSELNGKGASGRAPIDFLRETIEGYSNYKKLKRFVELKDKKTRDVLSEDEQSLMDRLKSDLAGVSGVSDFVKDN